jgi:hypothetical protein
MQHWPQLLCTTQVGKGRYNFYTRQLWVQPDSRSLVCLSACPGAGLLSDTAQFMP